MSRFKECPLSDRLRDFAVVSEVISDSERSTLVIKAAKGHQAEVEALLVGRMYAQRGGISYQGAVAANCLDTCNLCRPQVVVASEDVVTIVRRGYEPGSVGDRPQFEVMTNLGAQPVRPDITILFIDDRKLSLRRLLDEYAALFTCIGLHIPDGHRLSSSEGRRLRSTINENAPYIVVMDKNMVTIDTEELTEWLRELGIITVMITGEPVTREAHRRLTTYFLERNTSGDLSRLTELLNKLTNR